MYKLKSLFFFKYKYRVNLCDIIMSFYLFSWT